MSMHREDVCAQVALADGHATVIQLLEVASVNV